MNFFYWLCQVIGTELEEKTIVSLYSDLYAQDSPTFKSENREIIKAIDMVSQYTYKNGIWVIDRCDVENGKEYPFTLQFGYVPVKLPVFPNQSLYLVIVRGIGEKPLLLPTTDPQRRCQQVVRKVVHTYFKRWSIEETLRSIK